MSQRSGVPIEPPAQTQLLNACSKISGVVGGVVPGAGGFDAVALLIEDRQEVVDGLQKLLRGWELKAGTEHGNSVGKVSMLGVKQEMEGVRVEDVNAYEHWK